MTPYQRGNRDGLLNFAVWCDREADRYDGYAANAERQRSIARRPTHALACKELSDTSRGASLALRQTAAAARRMADALPEDPEPNP